MAGINVSDLLKGSRELDVVVREDASDESSEVLGVIHITYNPRAVTPEVERAMIAMMNGGGVGAGNASASLVRTAVTAWDLVRTVPDPEGEDGATMDEPIPITEGELDRLGISILAPIMIAIGMDMNPKARGRNGKEPARKTPAPPHSTSDSTKG